MSAATTHRPRNFINPFHHAIFVMTRIFAIK
jgi:hypothetical protein